MGHGYCDISQRKMKILTAELLPYCHILRLIEKLHLGNSYIRSSTVPLSLSPYILAIWWLNSPCQKIPRLEGRNPLDNHAVDFQPQLLKGLLSQLNLPTSDPIVPKISLKITLLYPDVAEDQAYRSPQMFESYTLECKEPTPLILKNHLTLSSNGAAKLNVLFKY